MNIPTEASPGDTVTMQRDETLTSVYLNRPVRLDILLPPGYRPDQQRYPVLYLNDGQDLERLRMKPVLDSLYASGGIRPFVLVAIHCGDRIQEYGTAARPDYMNRGSKAADYARFVEKELLPHVQRHWHVSSNPDESAFAGFSLGGLSAFDLVWNHPELFRRAGAFSGSFWWRSKAFDKAYTDNDRIMQQLVREGKRRPGLRFWLQTGTLDETDDRDNDGVIDSIDDTLDLIAELERKGYRWGKEVRYVEVKGGHHNPETWGAVMPDFLLWAFGAK